MSAAFERLVGMVSARALLLDMDGDPIRKPGDLWQVAQAELMMLVAEMEHPTPAGIVKRRESALALAAEMARFADHIQGAAQ